MVCTFGDLTDVTWWRELQLPTRAIVGRDGRIIGETPDWITTDAGREAFEAIAGKTVFSAKEAVVELLAAEDLIDGEPKKIMHPVNFFEKGDKPLEVVTSRQWYYPQRRPRGGPPRTPDRAAATKSTSTRPSCGPGTRTGSRA